MKRIIPFALLALAALAQKPSLNRADLDPACQPCQDFWRFANGGWVDKNPIPARFARWGTLAVLTEANRERMKKILEEAAAEPAAPPASPRRKIGDFYASCMDTEGIESRGTKPIQADLARIASVRSAGGIGASITEFQRRGGIGPFNVSALQDLKNSKEMIAYVSPGALSLPDRDYYFKDDARSKAIRAEFVKHVEEMLALLGDKPEAAAAAKKVLEFETALAEVMLTNVQRRDPYASYHRMDFAGLTALAPDYEWKELFKQLQLPETTPVNVSEPEFLKKFNAQLKALPADDWKTWLRWRVLNAAAPHLNKAFVDQDFAFSGTVLTGVTEQLPRWQTCAATVDRQLGDALGRMFVEKHFPPAARQRMRTLVENLRAALREELTGANWLAVETRQNAVAKLNAFVAKIGSQERWRAYATVKPARQSYFENVKTASIENRNYRLSKIGKPIDRNDWGMTPPTVNAYYSPLMNEIAFPAGILQPPLFDLEAGDEINYAAIGAVIGHEMGHGFDDQGSKFDAEGNLKNWWTDEDRAKFEARAGCVIDQYNKLDVGEGLRHNGKLVVGEAMGDLGGLTLAYKAWRRALRGRPEPPVVDGFTAEQRFFLSFARVWATVDRPESTRLRLNTDPHPLPKFRANGTLMNMPEFQQAFGCKAGDAMVRPAAVQCKLW